MLPLTMVTNFTYLALNNLLRLVCHKNPTNQPLFSLFLCYLSKKFCQNIQVVSLIFYIFTFHYTEICCKDNIKGLM